MNECYISHMLVEAFLSDDEESQVQRNKDAHENNDYEIVKWCVGIDLVIILVIAILCFVR